MSTPPGSRLEESGQIFSQVEDLIREVVPPTDIATVIDRIEVLEDGASPIYGSDAIAGVINIITRKEFNGVSVDAYAGGTNHADGLLQKYDVTWGSTTEKMKMVFGATFVDPSI